MSDAITERVRQGTLNQYFAAIMDILDRCPLVEPTWSSVAQSLGSPEDAELIAETYYRHKTYWEIRQRLIEKLK